MNEQNNNATNTKMAHRNKGVHRTRAYTRDNAEYDSQMGGQDRMRRGTATTIRINHDTTNPEGANDMEDGGERRTSQGME